MNVEPQIPPYEPLTNSVTINVTYSQVLILSFNSTRIFIISKMIQLLYFVSDTDLGAACQGWAGVVEVVEAGVEERPQAQRSYVWD